MPATASASAPGPFLPSFGNFLRAVLFPRRASIFFEIISYAFLPVNTAFPSFYAKFGLYFHKNCMFMHFPGHGIFRSPLVNHTGSSSGPHTTMTETPLFGAPVPRSRHPSGSSGRYTHILWAPSSNTGHASMLSPHMKASDSGSYPG